MAYRNITLRTIYSRSERALLHVRLWRKVDSLSDKRGADKRLFLHLPELAFLCELQLFQMLAILERTTTYLPDAGRDGQCLESRVAETSVAHGLEVFVQPDGAQVPAVGEGLVPEFQQALW